MSCPLTWLWVNGGIPCDWLMNWLVYSCLLTDDHWENLQHSLWSWLRTISGSWDDKWQMTGIGAWEWPATGKSMFNVLAQFITKPFLQNSCDVTRSCGKLFLQFRDIYVSKTLAHTHFLGKCWDTVGKGCLSESEWTYFWSSKLFYISIYIQPKTGSQ